MLPYICDNLDDLNCGMLCSHARVDQQKWSAGNFDAWKLSKGKVDQQSLLVYFLIAYAWGKPGVSLSL